MFCYIHKAAYLCKQKCDGLRLNFQKINTKLYKYDIILIESANINLCQGKVISASKEGI